MEGIAAGRRSRGRPRRRWIQDIKETFNMSIDEVEDLARDRKSFRRAVRRATFFKGQAS
jgi:hypothetical protein